MKKYYSTLVCLLLVLFGFSQIIVKGPYLQIGTQNSMIVRWETNIASNSRVTYGTSSVALTSTANNTAVSVTHTVQLTGLAPLTKYYYSIGTSTSVIQSGAQNFFLTSPVPDTEGPYRFWVTGDCGNSSTNQTNCKNQYIAFTGTTATNGWLLLGDNAYSSGTNGEFNTEFFAYYQTDIMKNAVLWPAPGNHDYNNGASTATTVPYYSIFSTPKNAEAGGVASGNPAYYSYDYGNVHFLSLDSYGTVGGNKMYDTTGAQVVWIKNDLAANANKRWKVAYWHHPPYTMGSHNSDTEGDLVNIHVRFVRILERMGIDLIMCGHSHDYERSRLMNGHYGNEASFNAGTHNKSSSSALYNGSANSCPYIKDSLTKKVGTVYALAGSAGQLGGTQGSFPHAAMYYSNATQGGSMVLDFNANRLDAKWVCADGVIRDNFTIFKDVNVVKTFTVTPTQTTVIGASWPGTFVWNNTSTTQSVSVTTSISTTFWVRDSNSCVADTFKFVVNGLPPTSNFGYTGPYCATVPVTFNDMSTNMPTSWSWSVTPSAGVTITTPTSQNPTITFNTAGNYTVTQQSTNGFGPGTSISKTLTINSNPIVTTVSSPTTGIVCIGNPITLTGGGATTYTWTGGITNAVAFTPTTSGAYTVTGTDGSGCKNTSVRSITVNPLPTVTAVSNPSTGIICQGQSITLTGSGTSTYTWTGGITNAVAFTPTASATFSVTGTATTGCQNNAVKSITVNPSPTANASTTQTLTCVNTTATLSGSGVTTYTWSGPGIVSGSNSANPVVNMAGTYSLVGSSGSCVSNIGVVNLTSNIATPSVSVTSSSNAICIGGSATLTASGANTYSWSTGSTATSIVATPTTTTNYILSGTNTVNGCTNTANNNITVNPLPTISANTSNSLICVGQSATITAGGAITYSWNTGPTTTNIVVSPSITTTYSVNGTDGNNCSNGTAFTQSVSACTGITSFVTNPNISVYPNPTSGVFSVELNTSGNFEIEVYNVVGALILKGKLNAGMNRVDLKAQSGIYYYTILDDHKIIHQGKLIVE